jgi:hypothetical protein
VSWFFLREKSASSTIALKKGAANKGISTMTVNGEGRRKELKKMRVTP